MKKKLIIATIIVLPVLILIILSPYIIKRIRDFNVKNPIIVNVEFDDEVQYYNEMYQLSSDDEMYYTIFYEAEMTKHIYRRNPYIFHMGITNFNVIGEPIEVEVEKSGTGKVKVTYKMIISVDGEFQNYLRFNFVWNLKHSPNEGVVCKIENDKKLKVNVTHYSTVDINFFHLNKLLFTYKVNKGETLSDVLYDGNISVYNGSNMSRLLNIILNKELELYFSYTTDIETYFLEELGFNGWICLDKSFSEPLYENINVYSNFENNGDCNFIKVNDLLLNNLNDFYFSPEIYVDFSNYESKEKEYIKNINYVIYSDSNIVDIKDNKFRLIEPGEAEITLEYDLGFYKGTRTFKISYDEKNL